MSTAILENMKISRRLILYISVECKQHTLYYVDYKQIIYTVVQQTLNGHFINYFSIFMLCSSHHNDCSRYFEVVTGESKKPVLTKSSSENEDEARKKYGVDYSIFKKANNKAQKYIITSVDELPLQYIMNCDAAKEMWDKLLSVYEQKSDSSVTLIQQKFYSFLINSDDNMAIHISKL
ncbi:hypothetical protein QTP88_006221 [Uroleucon formosanum]